MIKDHRLRQSIVWAAIWAGLIWCIRIIDVVWRLDLARFGIYPGTPHGLIGIVAAPLVHGSPGHLIANTLPVLILGSALFYGYPRSRWWTLSLVWILSGIGVWLWGRPSYHFGASGVVHGLLFFLFISGVIRRDRMSIVLCMVAFSMYGGMLMTIFPTEPEISFESHFCGAMAGVICAILFQRWDPKAVSKQYSWERTAQYQEDPVIGDLWMTEKQRARFAEQQAITQAERDSAEVGEYVDISSPVVIERSGLLDADRCDDVRVALQRHSPDADRYSQAGTRTDDSRHG